MSFKPWALAATVIAAVVIATTVWYPRNTSPKVSPTVMSSDEKQALEELARLLPGRVIFDSNRSGNFGIYSITTGGEDVRTIVDTDAHEVYPDPSPDGTSVVYGRTNSLERTASADVWIVAIDGSNPRMLAEDGTYPTFSADGKTVFFERGRKQVMAINLDGTNLREIFPANNQKFKRAAVVKPRVSIDGKILTFTSDKPRRWNAWYADLTTGEAFHIAHACEPALSNRGDFFAFIGKKEMEMAERSGIGKRDRKTGAISKLQDADAPWGHEYFPTLARDDQFLLYSACPEGQHAPEDSNFQLFIKDLTTGKVTRLTFDGHNNRWAKLVSRSETPGS